MKPIKNVDSYIENNPKEIQVKLKELRAAIMDIVPKAAEHISYGMPFYGYKGRLVYFGVSKNHIGVYIPPPVIGEHKSELKDYETTKSAVRIPLNKKLPITLIKKLVLARVKINEDANK